MTCPNCHHSMTKMFFRYFDRTPPEWYEWYCNECSTRLPVSPKKDQCKNCKYRELGCHVKCEDDKARREQNKETAKKRRSDARLNNYVNESIRRVKAAKGGWHSYRRKETPSE